MDFKPISLFPRVRTGVQMPDQSPLPSGLVYQPDLITKAEEQQALGVLEAMEFHTITMHGRTARRTVRHFGLDYGYESWKLVATDPLPDDLAWLQARAAVLAGWTRASWPRSSSPDIHRGAPSAGTATPPCSAPR
jgi:hypothetical protein